MDLASLEGMVLLEYSKPELDPEIFLCLGMVKVMDSYYVCSVEVPMESSGKSLQSTLALMTVIYSSISPA